MCPDNGGCPSPNSTWLDCGLLLLSVLLSVGGCCVTNSPKNQWLIILMCLGLGWGQLGSAGSARGGSAPCVSYLIPGTSRLTRHVPLMMAEV